MKNLIPVLALVFLSACAGQKARDEALLPVAQLTWPNVQVDYEAGISDGVADGDLDLPDAQGLLDLGDAMTSAIASGDRAALAVLPWDTTMAPWAMRGIDSAVDAGALGPNGAGILHQRVVNFTAMFLVLSERLYSKVPADEYRPNRYILEPQERRLLAALKD